MLFKELEPKAEGKRSHPEVVLAAFTSGVCNTRTASEDVNLAAYIS